MSNQPVFGRRGVPPVDDVLPTADPAPLTGPAREEVRDRIAREYKAEQAERRRQEEAEKTERRNDMIGDVLDSVFDISTILD